MPSQKKKTELLTFGYINKQTELSIPIAIIKLIQLFYDIYVYWSIKNGKMKKFVNAKNGDCLRSDKIFTIKGIKFGFEIFPNGRKKKHIGSTMCYLRLLELPSNIEYVGIYYHFNFEAVHCKKETFHKFTKCWNQGIIMTNLSKLNDLKQIDLNCFVDIKYIKYKSNVNKMDFIKPIKMKIKNEYDWNIKDELIAKCQTFKCGEYIISESFGDNNWNLTFFPNGTTKTENNAVIKAKYLIFPFDINRMEIKMKVSVNGDINIDGREGIVTFNGIIENSISWRSNGTFLFSAFKLKQSIIIHIQLEIVKLWDQNDKIVEKNNWLKYGIIA